MGMMHLFLDNIDQTRTLSISSILLEMLMMEFRSRCQPRNPQPVRVLYSLAVVEQVTDDRIVGSLSMSPS